MPEPSFRFEPGQCITLTSCSASSACSRSSTQTQCAAQRRGDGQAQAARGTRGSSDRPTARRTIASSSRDSDACVCTSAPLLVRQRRDGLEQLARAGDREARRERRAQPAVRPRRPTAVRIARLSSIDARVSSCSRRGTSGVEVHHALADRRAQPALRHRLEDGVRVVHRLHRQHGRRAARRAARVAASRAAARSDAGRVRRFHRPDARAQPVHQRQIVGVAAEQRLAEMDVRLDEARAARSRRARRSTRSCGSGDGRRRSPRCARRGSTRRRRRRRRRSFIVRIEAVADEEGHAEFEDRARQPEARDCLNASQTLLTSDVSLQRIAGVQFIEARRRGSSSCRA